MLSPRLFCAIAAFSISFSHYALATEPAIEYVPAPQSDEEIGKGQAPIVDDASPMTLVESCVEQESCTGCADNAACTPVCSLYSPREPGLILGAELLILRAHVRNPGLSEITDPVVPIPPGPGPFPPVVDVQQVQSFELPWEAGFRGQIGYRFDSGWDTLVQYTTYESEERQIVFGLGILAGALEVKESILDVEAGRWFSISPSHDVRLFGGLRWASLDTDYRRGIQSFVFNITRYQTEMDGFGVRLGGESHWNFGYGFSGFVRGAGSVLVADFDNTSFRFDDLGPINLIQIRQDSPRQGVPIVDVAAGLNYRWDKFEVQAGYELSHWFNAVPLPVADDFGSIDVTFDGFFARAGWNY